MESPQKLNSQNIVDIFALTPMQEGMLAHYLKEPKSDAYFEQLSIKISGELDLKTFISAWDLVIETNEMLRAVFRWRNVKEPVQIILKENNHFAVDYCDFSRESQSDRMRSLAGKMHEDKSLKHDLEKVPFRVILCRTAGDEHDLIISNHHIIYDGWSLGIILREFLSTYGDLLNKKKVTVLEKVKFREFVHWQQLQDRRREMENFWKRQLEDFVFLEFPLKRRNDKNYEGYAKSRFGLDSDARGRVDLFSREYRISLAALMYGCWGILLQHFNNSDEVIFGTTVSGRTAPIKGIESMVGLFINTLPLRIGVAPHQGSVEFLDRLSRDLQLREEFEGYSLAKIKEVNGIISSRDIFDTVVVIENYPLNLHSEQSKKRIAFESYSISERTHFDLTIGIIPNDDIGISFCYREKLFKREEIEKLCRYFIAVIKHILISPTQRIKDIDILPIEEKSLVLHDFNRTDTGYPQDMTIQQLFEVQVDKGPDNVAVLGEHSIFPVNDTGTVSYRELNQRANQLAHRLRSKGIGADGVVGLMATSTIEMALGILGILKAGAGYLPVDPEAPRSRILLVLKDSAVSVLLTHQGLRWRDHERFHRLDLDGRPILSGNTRNPVLINESRHLAYVIYTSGSSGSPKGVMVSHRNVINLMIGLKEKIYQAYKRYLRVALVAPFIFDASVKQIFGALLSGHALFVVPSGIRLEGRLLWRFFERYGINITDGTPAHMHILVEALDINRMPLSRSCPEAFIIGGEVLSSSIMELFFRCFEKGLRPRVINIYGPTECTVDSTCFEVTGESLNYFETLPIGTPLPNHHIYILDRGGRPQPVGIPGQLCIGGAGVTRGYLNNPGLTQDAFGMSSPLSERWLYRSGDLARWLPDGNLEFLGRIDRQVKIRGYRIEPGEIERHILENEEIREAMVLCKRDGIDEKYLCAYLVPHVPDTFEIARLRDYLIKKLPRYMIPESFTIMKEMPLTSSGKMDSGSLPKPAIDSKRKYISPRNQRERILADIWSDVLSSGREAIGVDDDFFDSGGNSLKAVRLMGRLQKIFEVEFSISQFFETPTIRALSQNLSRARRIPITTEIVEKREYYPLSSAQKRIFVLQQMEMDSIMYNMSGVIIVEGEIKPEQFNETFRELINRHESLRTSFEMIDTEPKQLIRELVEFNIENYITDCREMRQYLAEPHTRYRILSPGVNKIIGVFIRPFVLSQAPLLRAGLLRIDSSRHLLMVDMHHLISDGLSVTVLVRDFAALYEGTKLPLLQCQYKDYVGWQEREELGETHRRQKRFWLEVFEGEIPVLDLPIDYPRPETQSFAGRTINYVIPDKKKNALTVFALKNNVSLFILLISVYSIFLSKLCQKDDVVIGSPVAGRYHADWEQIVGMFVNTLALRYVPAEEKNYIDYLREVRKETLRAFDNQEYQFEKLVEQLGTYRNSGRNPLFNTFFALNDGEDFLPSKPDTLKTGLQFRRCEIEEGTAKFDLDLTVWEISDQLVLNFNYCTGLFKEETVQRFLSYFIHITDNILGDPYQKISRIRLITDEERDQILNSFNNTEKDWPKDQTVTRLFEEQVERNPHLVAVKFEDSELTYNTLNVTANQLAGRLEGRGVSPDFIVGIIVHPSIDMAVGLWTVLKAGGAYLPIDPEYPEARIEYILDESRLDLLLVHPRTKNKFKYQGETLDVSDSVNFTGRSSNLRGTNNPGDIVYIIYTSGSSGRPKGVMVEHGNLSAYLNAFFQMFDIGVGDHVIQQAAFSFDAFIEEFFAPLLKGGKVCMTSKHEVMDIVLLKQFILKNNIAMISCSPLLLNELNQLDSLGHIRLFISGGDVLKGGYIGNIVEIADVYNTYGPTETTVCAAYYQCSGSRHPAVPVGSPIANYRIYIVDRGDAVLPVGIPGELTIGGPGVARGYMDEVELTSEKFVDNPFKKLEKLYRTGDLGRWRPDGNIEFLGRIDRQVKIRGFRIEPAEIERQIAVYNGIRDVLVICREDEWGDKHLSAYFEAEEDFDVNGLIDYLYSVLPAYMVPSYFTPLEKIPLTHHGKADLTALPDPDISRGDQFCGEPADDIEETLATIWAEVLGIEKKRLSMKDNFFRLGGHSLKATIMAAKCQRILNVHLPLAEIFLKPTIRGIADYIKKAARGQCLEMTTAPRLKYYPLSPAQKRLFILHQLDEIGTAYNISVVLKLAGELEKGKLEDIFRQLINRHESLRTAFVVIDREPVQKVSNTVDFSVEHIEADPVEIKTGINNFIKPFDLSKPPLLRVGIAPVEKKIHILVLDMHHIISDAISATILVNDLIALYRGDVPPPLKFQYKDFAYWQSSENIRRIVKKQEDYWLEKYTGEIPLLMMPTDYPRPSKYSFEGSKVYLNIDRGLTVKIMEKLEETDVTLNILFLTVYNMLLLKYTGQEKIVVGVPVSGRVHADLENIVGFFANMLAIKSEPRGYKTFKEFLEEVKRDSIEAYENQEAPFDELVWKLNIERQPGRHPLVDTVLVVENEDVLRGEVQEIDKHNLKVAPFEFEDKISHFDLMFLTTPMGGVIQLMIEYRTSIFKRSTVRMMGNHFVEILEQVVENQNPRLDGIVLSQNLFTARSKVFHDDKNEWFL